MSFSYLFPIAIILASIACINAHTTYRVLTLHLETNTGFAILNCICTHLHFQELGIYLPQHNASGKWIIVNYVWTSNGSLGFPCLIIKAHPLTFPIDQRQQWKSNSNNQCLYAGSVLDNTNLTTAACDPTGSDNYQNFRNLIIITSDLNYLLNELNIPTGMN